MNGYLNQHSRLFRLTSRPAGTGPHHVFRIEGEKIRSKLTLIPSLNSELENFALMSVLRMKISLKKNPRHNTKIQPLILPSQNIIIN